MWFNIFEYQLNFIIDTRHILYKFMCIDLHSLDIGRRPRNSLHPSPIPYQNPNFQKEKPAWIDNKASNEFLYFPRFSNRLLPLPPIPPHLFLHEKMFSKHGLQWTIFLSDSQSLEEESLAFLSARRKFHIFLFLVHRCPRHFPTLDGFPLPFHSRYLKLGPEDLFVVQPGGKSWT